METEKQLNPKTFAEIEVEMKNRGFAFVGKEPLVIFGYDAEQRRFRPTSYRSREEIVESYRQKLGGDPELHIELVDVPNLTEDEESVYVFHQKAEEV